MADGFFLRPARCRDPAAEVGKRLFRDTHTKRANRLLVICLLEVQPAVRKTLGRNDVWGVGLAMSPTVDAENGLEQFQLAYEAPWLNHDRRLQVEGPEIREGMIKALEAYTLIRRKGCTPPDSISWTSAGNNEAFLAQTVVMTTNATLSIPGALRTARPDDYYENAATIDWPDGPRTASRWSWTVGSRTQSSSRTVKNPALAGDFVRFLAEGLDRPLADVRRRPIAAADAQAGGAAVLAGPERPAPHARGHPDPDSEAPVQP